MKVIRSLAGIIFILLIIILVGCNMDGSPAAIEEEISNNSSNPQVEERPKQSREMEPKPNRSQQPESTQDTLTSSPKDESGLNTANLDSKQNNDVGNESVKSVPIQDVESNTPKPKQQQENSQTFNNKAPSKTDTSIISAGVPTLNSLLPHGNSEPRSTPITHLLIHFISNAANKPQDPYIVQDIRKTFIDYGVSAHYMIERDGRIHLLVPENRIAYHAGKGSLANFPQYKNQLNKYSIGIELLAIGTKAEMRSMLPDSTYDSINPENIGFTDAQYQSLKRLMDDIVARNPSIKKDRNHIIGHDEYAPGRKTVPVFS